MLIWKAKAAKSTGALKSVSVHQFDNTFTMKTSNCKAFSIDTRLQLRLQGLRKFRLFSFLPRGWENFNSSIFFLKPRQCLRQQLPHKSLYHIRLWQTRCYLMTPLFTVFSSLLPTDAANSPQRIQLPSLSLLFPVWRNLFCGAHLFSVWEHKEAQIQLFTLIVCVTQTHAEPFIFKRNSGWRMCVVGNWKKV